MYISFIITLVIAFPFFRQIPCYIVNNNAYGLKILALGSHNDFKHRFRSELLQDLYGRDILDKLTDENGIDNLLLSYDRKESPLSVYIGIDITSSKAHIGTLFQLVTLRKFFTIGLDVVILMGGGTTIVGDPSFTVSARSSLHTLCDNLSQKTNTKFSYITQSHVPSFDHILNARRDDLISTIGHIMTRPLMCNNKIITPQLELFTPYNPDEFPKVWIVDNASIHKNISLSEYLELVGNNFQLNRMLSRDCIIKRLGKSEEDANKTGMNFSELAYMTLQALDFVHLSQTYNVRIQIGGSDQWGNIVSGVDLAKSLNVSDLYGITTKLLLDTSKNKLSKSNSCFETQSLNKSDSTIWLSPTTCALNVWQFFRNTQDENVSTFIKYFTDIPINEINELVATDINYAKGKLSDEVTLLMYGYDAVNLINKFWAFNKDRSNVMINIDQLTKLDADSASFIEFLKYVPSQKVSKSTIVMVSGL